VFFFFFLNIFFFMVQTINSKIDSFSQDGKYDQLLKHDVNRSSR